MNKWNNYILILIMQKKPKQEKFNFENFKDQWKINNNLTPTLVINKKKIKIFIDML